MLHDTRPLITVASLVLLVAACSDEECARSADCDDGIFCNGPEQCVQGRCLDGIAPDCDDDDPGTEDRCDPDLDRCVHTCLDADGDGHEAESCGGDDCDDGDPDVYAGAPDACDGKDNDCSGEGPEEDVDGDGHWDDVTCAGHDLGDDCDDSNPAVHGGHEEPCDGVDNNCVDGTDDEADTDGDGRVEEDCSTSPGGDDCDDEDPLVYPGAEEICNGEDEDCDGAPDETFDCVMGETVSCTTPCDTAGTGTCTEDCEMPTGDDCVSPGEVCNGEDDDCDTLVDEDFECAAGYETDCWTICDSVGTGTCTPGCRLPDPADCEPPESETCNGADDDCDGECDEDFFCCAGVDLIYCETWCGSIVERPCTADCTAPEGDLCPPEETELSCTWDGDDTDCDGDYGCLDLDCLGTLGCG